MTTARHTAGSILSLLLLLTAAPAASFADGESPASLAAVSGLAANPNGIHPAVPVVESLHDALIELMKSADELGYAGRTEALKPILEDSFDLDFMAKKSIGRSWKKLSEEEQTRWLDTFRRLTRANYAGRFEGHSGQSFETREVTAGLHDTMMIQTTLLNPAGDDVELNYRVIEREAGWRIIDVYLDGTVSELALRKADFSAVIKRQGFEKLLTDVDRHVAELAAVN